MKKNVFIGRKNELQLLHNAFSEVEKGNGKLVLIEGNAGIGKSELVRNFINNITENHKVTSAISECNDKENLNAYAPFKELLIELNSKSFSQKEEGTSKLKKFITEAGTGWIGLIPVIGSFAATGIDTYKAYKNTYKNDSKSPIESKNDIYRIFENEFRRLSKDNPVIIFIDDLQWADASSLNLIFALGKIIRSNPFKILIIGSFRPNEIKAGRTKLTEEGNLVTLRHPFADKLNELRNYCKSENHISQENWLVEIEIKPLTNEEVYELIQQKFHPNNFSEDFYKNINNLTDGQPLYLVEILDYLLRNEIIEQVNGTFTSKHIQFSNLPVSLNGVISEKVERLGNELKKVLSYASVDGEEFSVKIIEKILKIDELDLLDYLEELSQKHSLLVASEPIRIKNMLLELYSFSQTLVHKYMYDNMDSARRRALHRRIAATIKEIYGEDTIESNKEIKNKYNYHFQIGEGLIDAMDSNTQENEHSLTTSIKEKPSFEIFIDAAKTEIQNAKDSFEQYAINECSDFIDKSLAFLSKVDDSNIEKQQLKFEAILLRSKFLQWQGYYQKALDTSRIAENIAKNYLTDLNYLGQINICIAKAMTSLGNCENALLFLQQSNSIFEENKNLEILWESYVQTGITKTHVAAFNEAIEYHKKAFEIAKKLNDESKKAENLLEIGNNLSYKAEYDKAIEYYDNALKTFEEQQNTFQIGHVYNKKGLALRNHYLFDEALPYFQKAFAIAEEQNDFVNMSHRTNNIALIFEDKGDFNKAISYFKKSLAIDEKLDDKPMIVKSLNNLGSAYIEIGENEKAKENFDKALNIAENLNDKGILAFTFSTIGHAFYQIDEANKSIEYIQKAISIDLELEDELSAANNYNGLGNAYLVANKINLAKENYENALKFYEKVNHPASIAMIQNNLGTIYSRENNQKEAINYYEKSLEFLLSVNDKLGASKCYGNIANCYYHVEEYNKAIEFYKKATAYLQNIDEKLLISGYYTDTGNAYYNLNDYENATVYYQKAIEIFEQLNKKTELASNLEFLGYSYFYNNQYKEAATTHNKQLSIELELNNLDSLAKCYSNLGLDYYWDEQYITSVENYNKALTIYIELYGENHEKTATCYYDISLSYYWHEKYGEAINYQLKALSIRKQLFGENSAEVDQINFALAQTYFYANMDELAKKSLKISLEFRLKNYGRNHELYQKALEFSEKLVKNEPVSTQGKSAPENVSFQDDVTSNPSLGIDYYIENGDKNYENKLFDDALNDFHYALEQIKKLPESVDKNSYLALIHYKLGLVYKSLKNYKVARGCFITATNGFIELYGKFNINTARSYSFLGDAYYYLDDNENALKSHTLALESYQNISDENDIMIAWCHYDIGKDYYWLENYEKSIEHYQKCLQIRIKNYGEEHKSIASVYLSIGLSYYWNKQYELSILNQTKAFEMRKRLFGTESPEFDESRFYLGKAYYYANMDEIAKKYLFESLNFRKSYFGEKSTEYEKIRKWIEDYIIN